MKRKLAKPVRAGVIAVAGAGALAAVALGPSVVGAPGVDSPGTIAVLKLAGFTIVGRGTASGSPATALATGTAPRMSTAPVIRAPATGPTSSPIRVAATGDATGDAKAGEKVFKKCKACHRADETGKNGTGPNLWGIVGRDVAAVEGFKYSEAMKKLGGVWDEATLDAYLTKPKKMVPGTKMSFAGLRNPDDRANVIAFLATKKAAAAAAATDAASDSAVEDEALAGFSNPPPRSAEDIAQAEARAAAIKAEVDAGMDYQRARYHPIHFPPAINTASNEECLVCHQEIMDHKPRAASPAGVPASETIAWYQTLDTYAGDQESFHWRHLESPYAREVMNLQCNFCHKGNDPREESPEMVPTRAAGTAPNPPEFANRKMVNPSETCLLCHGAMPDPDEIMGIGAPWPEARLDIEDEETVNGCLSCHGEFGFRTNRHNVSYLNARNIERIARKKSDTCFGCHGGRQWYQISYPYPRHPWPDMDEEVPEWAKDRPTESKPEYQLPPKSAE